MNILENELGCKLFIRSNRGVQLTKREGRLPNMTTANKTIKINDVEAAKKLVCAAVRCPFDIDIVSKGKIFIDAKSILGVLSLDVEEPLELKYDGYDEDFESVIAGLAC